MVRFSSAAIFIDSATKLCDKIVKIDLIIDALLLVAATAAVTDHIEEYSLNDGQTIIRTEYRGTDAVVKSIKAFEMLRELYINKVNGRVFRLVDAKSFFHGRHGRH